jgi:F-type H+-transporting ATPase subunit delta
MSLRTSATRYAKALLDVAAKESDPAQVERDLDAIVRALTGHDELRRILANRATPAAIRVNLVRAVAERAAAQPPVTKLVVILAERGRLELLPDLLDVYRERLLAHNNVVRGSVTTATPLAPPQLDALARSLGTLTGKDVRLDVEVDPSLIGGVVARLGSTVYDGSIRTQLEKLKQELIESA